jgi:anti-sigma factor RsiW
MDCQQARLSLGVLVLGVIDPEERPALEAHLTVCERCSAELAELAVLPGLLHRLDPVAAAPALPSPPASFQERVVAAGRVARARHRRRLVAALGTAAAVIAAALLVPRPAGRQ